MRMTSLGIMAICGMLSAVAVHAQTRSAPVTIVGQTDPISVSGTVVTVPVSSTPLDPTKLWTLRIPVFATGGSSVTIPEGLTLTGYYLTMSSAGGAASTSCSMAAGLYNTDLVYGFLYAWARAGRDSQTPFIPLPNVKVPAGYKLNAGISDTTGQDCFGQVVLFGLLP